MCKRVHLPSVGMPKTNDHKHEQTREVTDSSTSRDTNTQTKIDLWCKSEETELAARMRKQGVDTARQARLQVPAVGVKAEASFSYAHFYVQQILNLVTACAAYYVILLSRYLGSVHEQVKSPRKDDSDIM